MNQIQYVNLNEIKKEDLVSMLNKSKVREHLVRHEIFDSDNILPWLKTKTDMNSLAGCKIRGVLCQNEFAGWCGIQLENEKYEIAIVLDEKYWGIGKALFFDMMAWAKELGHDEIYIHLLDTRPESRFLRKISKQTFKTELHGENFTTYQVLIT